MGSEDRAEGVEGCHQKNKRMEDSEKKDSSRSGCWGTVAGGMNDRWRKLWWREREKQAVRESSTDHTSRLSLSYPLFLSLRVGKARETHSREDS